MLGYCWDMLQLSGWLARAEQGSVESFLSVCVQCVCGRVWCSGGAMDRGVWVGSTSQVAAGGGTHTNNPARVVIDSCYCKFVLPLTLGLVWIRRSRVGLYW